MRRFIFEIGLYIIQLFVVCCFLNLFSTLAIVSEESLLSQALDEVLGSIKPIKYSTLHTDFPSKSSIRRRCEKFLACEYHVPVVEIEGAVIYNGILYLNQIDTKSAAVISSLKTLYAGQENHLPSVLVQRRGRTDWIPGLKVVTYTSNDISSPVPKQCATYWNITAQFLFPWEVNNAFHSINDNVLSVLASMILQHIYYKTHPSNIPISRKKILFVFRKLGGDSPSISLLYRIIHILFDHRQDIRPVNVLLQDMGPHCIDHMTWGTAMKPFYRDSLIELRRVIFKVLYRTLRLSSRFPSSPTTELQSLNRISLLSILSHAKESISYLNPIYPRVIIVTRNNTKADPSPFRKLSRKSEMDLQAAFQKKGSPTLICCNFQQIGNPQKLLSYFGYADICIGIHGAGLTNCILGSENMIVVELQNEHAYGFDSFMKISHMANGVYIFYDIRSALKHRGVGAGAILDSYTIQAIVELCYRIYHHIRIQRLDGKDVSYEYLYAMNTYPHSHIIDFRNTSSVQGSDQYHNNQTIVVEYSNFRELISGTDRDKFLIIPSPSYTYPKNQEAIYGPKLEENTDHCRQLDYYKFRKFIQSPMQEKDYCDRNFIHRYLNRIKSNRIESSNIELLNFDGNYTLTDG